MDHGGERLWGRSNEAASLIRFPAAAGAGAAWETGPREWTDWPGLWSPQGTPKSPGNQPHFRTPWINECADDSSCPNESMAASSATTRTTTVSSCSSWFGPDVAVLACDPRRLARGLREQRMGEPGSTRIRLGRGGARAASAPGLTQLLGRPLVSGERLELAGAQSATDLRLRVRDRTGVYVARFSSPALRRVRTVHVRLRRPNRATAARRSLTVELAARTTRVRANEVRRTRRARR
jgi:hypothetical protein